MLPPQDVQAAINAAAGQLPKNLPSPPTYKKTNPSDATVMVLALNSATLPLPTVNNYADNVVAQQLSQIDGVALVAIAGAQKLAVRVEANPVALAGRGLSLEDVRAAIDVIRPDGSVEPRPLRVGATHQGETLISSGLLAGERVVVDGHYRLSASVLRRSRSSFAFPSSASSRALSATACSSSAT